MKSWKPVLPPELKKKAWNYIENLASDLVPFEKMLREQPDFRVFTGGMGASLFYRYLFLETGEKKYLKSSQSLLNTASAAAGRIPSVDTLGAGITGAGWVAEHFRREKKIKWRPGQDPNHELDDLLILKIRNAQKAGGALPKYGLLDDWIGYGVYGLERFPFGRSVELLEGLVMLFKERARFLDEGVAWFTPKSCIPFWERKNHLHGYYNLGLAHGNAGIARFLAGTLKARVLPEITGPLLEGSLRWFQAHDSERHFGNMLGALRKKSQRRKPRLAWCYGDLGMGSALLNASTVLGNKELEKWAMEVVRRSSKFLEPGAQNRVVDGYFCHGATGNFHMFNRLYQQTGEKVLLKAALICAKQAFRFFENKESEIQYNLFTGKTGAGLSLLAGVSKIEPAWDRILLLSPL